MHENTAAGARERSGQAGAHEGVANVSREPAEVRQSVHVKPTGEARILCNGGPCEHAMEQEAWCDPPRVESPTVALRFDERVLPWREPSKRQEAGELDDDVRQQDEIVEGRSCECIDDAHVGGIAKPGEQLAFSEEVTSLCCVERSLRFEMHDGLLAGDVRRAVCCRSMLGIVLDFLRDRIASWTEGNLWYDEHVPGWALAPVLILAGSGSVAMSIRLGSETDGRLPAAAMVPMVVASAGLACAIVGKWVLTDGARSVALATVASLWAMATWLSVVPAGPDAIWPPLALVFMSPVLTTAFGRAWAMLAWHHRMEIALRRTWELMQPLLSGERREGVLLVHVDAVDGDNVRVTFHDGLESFAGRARRDQWSSVQAGSWYLAEGAMLKGWGNAEVPCLTGMRSLEFLGVVDPRTDRERETFVPEITFWVVALGGLMVVSASGAWALVRWS